jgi:hypothetical protein
MVPRTELPLGALALAARARCARGWRASLGAPGWLALAAVATLMAVGGVTDALRRVVHGDFVGIVTLPLGLVFWYWIGVGEWRRAVHHA